MQLTQKALLPRHLLVLQHRLHHLLLAPPLRHQTPPLQAPHQPHSLTRLPVKNSYNFTVYIDKAYMPA